MSFAGGRLFFLRLLMPRVLCFLSWSRKKESKEPAGNTIPRSRLPSERKIAHSRVGSFYPYFDTNVRSREYLIIAMFSLSQAGATPGAGLQTVRAGSGR